ncbi:MAG: cobalt-precorrin-6A reductase [Alphaproteobacteria bacterium]
MAAPEVLILGGTAEAAELARQLVADGRVAPLTSLAGRTPRPAHADRTGGFGGARGLESYLRSRRPAAVIDATHPFAARMAANAVAATSAAGIPLLRLERPPWSERPADTWLHLPDLAAAAALIADLEVRVFLSLGAAHLDAFSASRRPWLLARAINPPRHRPFRRGRVIAGRGPFSLLGELSVMRRHRIDVLVARNSGGAATYAKIAAARLMSLPVLMVDRPCRVPVATVTDVAAARAWLERLVSEMA